MTYIAASAAFLQLGMNYMGAQAAKAAGQAKAEQMQMFSNVAFVKNPDMVPPKPVYQNVTQAAFMDALSIAGARGGIVAGVKA